MAWHIPESNSEQTSPKEKAFWKTLALTSLLYGIAYLYTKLAIEHGVWVTEFSQWIVIFDGGAVSGMYLTVLFNLYVAVKRKSWFELFYAVPLFFLSAIVVFVLPACYFYWAFFRMEKESLSRSMTNG